MNSFQTGRCEKISISRHGYEKTKNYFYIWGEKRKPNGMNVENTASYAKMTDTELLEAIYSGDKKAEAYLLCDKCAPVIAFHMQTFFTREQIELDEAIHEVYLHLQENGWARLRKYEGRKDCSIKSYISVIARHLLMSRYKSMNREWLLMQEFVSDQWMTRLAEREATGGLDESHIKVNRTLQTMPNIRYKTILTKLYYENKTPQEIANEMNISRAYFFVICGRAEQQFREYYKKNQ